MTTLSTYLLLNGDCRAAMEFYRTVFGGELSMTTVGESPMAQFFPPPMHSKIVNARLVCFDGLEISASDWLRPDQTPTRGNMVCLFLSGGSRENLKSLFEKLAVGAELTDPISEQPFGMYGALNDQFGIRWMFQTE